MWLWLWLWLLLLHRSVVRLRLSDPRGHHLMIDAHGGSRASSSSSASTRKSVAWGHGVKQSNLPQDHEVQTALLSTLTTMDAPQNLFCLVSQNLRSIGALTVDAFLNNLPNDCLSDLRKPTRKASQPHGISPITRLAQACSRAFSLPNLINYELLEKDDMTGVRWKCILTINRPDGQARSYQTQFVHPRKQDARTGAANIALRLGAIEFITSFGRNSGFQREAHDTPALANDGAETVNHVEKIESLCRQWHNEQVSPQWIQFMVVDQQNRGYGAAKYGAALRVQLSPHLLEVYSTDTTFLSYSEAQAMCAREAVENGVLDFIRSASSGSSEAQLASVPPPPLGSNDHTTLHIFFDALPKPFPDFPDPHAKTFAELTRAPVAYVNNALQSCRGSRFSVQYIWNSDYTHNRKHFSICLNLFMTFSVSQSMDVSFVSVDQDTPSPT